jgi:hypothetical protein
MLAQKTGFGLVIHNIFHTKNFSQSSKSPDNTSNYSCNCIDDFTMPFTETETVDIPLAPVSYFEFISFYRATESYTSKFFNTLRAPPAVQA